jgi:hypothetical protein
MACNIRMETLGELADPDDQLVLVGQGVAG